MSAARYLSVNTCPQLSSGGQISAAEFRDQVLVTGADTGELRLHTQHQADTVRRGGGVQD